MVEGLTCFRVDISQIQKSMVVCAAVDFLFYGGLVGRSVICKHFSLMMV